MFESLNPHPLAWSMHWGRVHVEPAFLPPSPKQTVHPSTSKAGPCCMSWLRPSAVQRTEHPKTTRGTLQCTSAFQQQSIPPKVWLSSRRRCVLLLDRWALAREFCQSCKKRCQSQGSPKNSNFRAILLGRWVRWSCVEAYVRRSGRT